MQRAGEYFLFCWITHWLQFSQTDKSNLFWDKQMFCSQGLSIPRDIKGRLTYWPIFMRAKQWGNSYQQATIRSSMLIHTQMHTGIMIFWYSLPCWSIDDVSEADGVHSTLDAEVFLTGTLPLNFHGLLANGDKLFACFIVVFSTCSKDLFVVGVFFFKKKKQHTHSSSTSLWATYSLFSYLTDAVQVRKH